MRAEKLRHRYRQHTCNTAFTRQECLGERAKVLPYTRIACFLMSSESSTEPVSSVYFAKESSCSKKSCKLLHLFLSSLAVLMLRELHNCILTLNRFLIVLVNTILHCLCHYISISGQSQWPLVLRLGSASARFLALRVRMPTGNGWISVLFCQVEISASG